MSAPSTAPVGTDRLAVLRPAVAGLATVVVPTIGRPSLRPLVEALVATGVPTVVVDDRPVADGPLDLPAASGLHVVISGGRGPAAARNVGWRSAVTPWVVFLDDDVAVDGRWVDALVRDLQHAAPGAVAVQGRLVVPRPDTPVSEHQQTTTQLQGAAWITADMAVRRDALVLVGGFDERFPRAYREDTDLAIRLQAGGGTIAPGTRTALHPVPPTRRFSSLRRQRGNADDGRMLLFHGRGWHDRGQAPRGRRRRHAATTGAGLLALALAVRRALSGWPSPAGGPSAWVMRLAAAGWVAGTAELTLHRLRRGAGTWDEALDILLTSPLLPPLACVHWTAGVVDGLRRLQQGPSRRHPRGRAAAVLFDRDGTLVEDVPYNGDPDFVRPRPQAAQALQRLRDAGIPTAVVTNQRAVGEGWITMEQVAAVHDRLTELVGPLGPVVVCPHTPADGCGCRKPAPGMIHTAADALGVDVRDCVVVGDIWTDVAAATAAGARGVLVPDPATRREEVRAAPVVAGDVAAAVELILEARA